MKFSVAAFEPRKGDTLESQVSDCLEQLAWFASQDPCTGKAVITVNFFLSAATREEYREMAARVGACLSGKISGNVPLAYLAQAPASGALVAAEAYFIGCPDDSKMDTKWESGNPYLVIQDGEGEKLVIANGIGAANGPGDITGDAQEVFGVMERILRAEGMDLSHIFRQWNYIEEITVVESNESHSQHYQQFNNVRTDYYSRSTFKQGYPAATGIGIRAGGVIVGFFAATPGGYRTLAIENPLQTSAFEYTDRVLVGIAQSRGGCKCSPKFARAKFVQYHEIKQVFVSGTASIREEVTVGVKDIARQTEITLENIQKLLCRETLSAMDEGIPKLPVIDFIRVYIKRPENYQTVKDICQRLLPGVPGIYVVSDVCRENLLVEIEALATA